MTMWLWLMVSRGFGRMLGSQEVLWADECSHSLASHLVLRRSQYKPILQNGEASVVHACCCRASFLISIHEGTKHHGYGDVTSSKMQQFIRCAEMHLLCEQFQLGSKHKHLNLKKCRDRRVTETLK